MALESADGWTLIDTGVNTALIRDTPLYERMHGRKHDIAPIPPDGDGDSLLRLKSIAADRGLPLVAGHDPVAWPTLTAALTTY